MRRAWIACGLVVGTFCAGAALAWNPLSLTNGAPKRWDTSGPVVWNPDGGPLGKLNNADAVAMSADAFDVWENVTTSVLDFEQGGQIIDPNTGNPTDVTSANYNDVINADNGQNPIIYDNDRDIFDMLGTPSGVLGFAGVLRATSGGEITKAYVVMQGDWYDDEPQGTPPSDPGDVSEDTFRGVKVHEFGHFSGLGHSSVNHELGPGLRGCPEPDVQYLETMGPAAHSDAQTLHNDDEVGLSVLYPTAAFESDFATIRGTLVDRDGSTPFEGANLVVRPDTTDCAALFGDAQAMQSGANPAENGGAGTYAASGLTPGSLYTVRATTINDGYSYLIDPPSSLGGPDDYHNGADEDWFQPPDDPDVIGSVTAPTAGQTLDAIDVRINNAGNPAEVLGDAMSRLTVSKVSGPLDPEGRSLDDGDLDGATGYGGTAQAAWINRFTPAADDLPLDVQEIAILFWHDSLAVGRPIRLLVYSDPNATGNPANATLVYTEDRTIQQLSTSEFNVYELDSPVRIEEGEFYVGAYDLEADAPDSLVISYDSDTDSGRSYRQANSTAPGGYSVEDGRTWMVRAQTATIAPEGSVSLDWGDSCNIGAVPDQDYGVYEGTLAALPDAPDDAPITCTTGKLTEYDILGASPDRYWLVSPVLANREGSQGRSSGGTDRIPTTSCEEINPDPCP
jgi:hypothetical protein